MSRMVWDIDVIDNDDYKKFKKIVGQKLIDVIHDEDDLVLIFETKKVRISMQDSDAYGTNVFFDFENNKLKEVK